MANQRFGQPAGVRRLPMRVDAPLGHRAEGRAKPGSVCLTSRDAAVQGSGGKNAGPGTAGRRSTSQDAGLHLEHVEEELLDYEEEEEVHEVAVQAGAPVETPKVNKRAVQGDRLVGRHQELVAGNLFRGKTLRRFPAHGLGSSSGCGVFGRPGDDAWNPGLAERNHRCCVDSKTLQSHMERLKIELEHLKACAAEETKMMSELEGKFRNQTEKIVNTFELLNQFLEKEKEQLLCKLKEEHEEIMRKIRGKLTELEKQQSTHRDLITEIDGQCQQPDVQLLKNVQSILIRCNNLKAQEPQENAVVEQTLKCIGQHASLQEKLLELKTTFPVELEWRYIKASACSVTLDPDTAHRKLVVSVDGKSVIRGNRSQYLLDSPQRFDPALIVLGRERLSSGRHYWEVEVGNKTRWILGVCDEAVSRKGKITRTPKNGYWMVWLRDGKYEVNTFISTLLTPCVVPKTIGLFLDYEAGRLSLYNVDDRSLLFTFSTTSFPPTLRPFFNPHSKYGGRNAGGLRILTVSRFELKDETVRCSRKRSSL
ncbi:E3 ubiquitin-protein ligase TRIM11-like isoform X1 [Pleurodeles waltl]|uniref:E3 ubiquitin-protein ligase TRIM11-like isoform X1 n=1 Tax=Pleurodeles waltl TaxID=8319 RepID=UPI00370961F4